jgi:predicted RNase H-like HicB family nuclease
MARYKYLVVIEQGQGNLSAYVPDLDGCVTTGQTVDEVLHNMQEALSLHIEGMLEDGDPLPPATHVAADFVEVNV